MYPPFDPRCNGSSSTGHTGNPPSIPHGIEIAQKTLNSRVGIEGGISVLGTTGLVEPWDDHLEESIRERLSSSCNALLTTGRMGTGSARILYPEYETVLVGGKISEALGAARGDVILFGLPALILKYHRSGPPRWDWICHH